MKFGYVISPPAPTHEVAPVEATTTQGNKVVFPGGDISWVDAIVSFTPSDPAASRSRDPIAALGKPDYQGTDGAKDEATYVSLGHGGELVPELTGNVLVDGEGLDLASYEIGPEVEPILIAERSYKFKRGGKAKAMALNEDRLSPALS